MDRLHRRDDAERAEAPEILFADELDVLEALSQPRRRDSRRRDRIESDPHGAIADRVDGHGESACGRAGNIGPKLDRIERQDAAIVGALVRLLERGAVLAFGSDAPVEPIDPLLGIHAAVTRRRPGDRDAWFPAQKLTLDEALHAYTAGAAYATGREREWGTLEVGMRCDATVVDRDLAKLEENELLEAKVRATITDGVVRYSDGLG